MVRVSSGAYNRAQLGQAILLTVAVAASVPIATAQSAMEPGGGNNIDVEHIKNRMREPIFRSKDQRVESPVTGIRKLQRETAHFRALQQHCPYQQDGECDEGQFCAVGTDVDDCFQSLPTRGGCHCARSWMPASAVCGDVQQYHHCG